jgi:hypothetical protein
MAFNITSWSRGGRDFGRGAPPPAGSVEWAAVGDMWRSKAKSTSPKVGYNDLDAAKRWVAAISEQVRCGRADKILSPEDEHAWESFLDKWRPVAADLSLPGRYEAEMKTNKTRWSGLLSEAAKMSERHARAGARAVPLPYASEICTVSLQTPPELALTGMETRLSAVARCGARMLDPASPWWPLVGSRDTKPLANSVRDAARAARGYQAAGSSKKTFKAGDSVYDRFRQLLARVWVEAAALSDIAEPRPEPAEPPAVSAGETNATPSSQGTSALWVLAAAGAGYLGLSWLGRRWMYGSSPRRDVVVGVPDAIPREEEIL